MKDYEVFCKDCVGCETERTEEEDKIPFNCSCFVSKIDYFKNSERRLIDTIYCSSEGIADITFGVFVQKGFAVLKSTQMVEGLGHRIRIDILK